MKPTEMAQALAPVIRGALMSLDDVILGQQAFDPARATRQFTIAPNSYVEFVLMPVIVARLRECAPGIRLRLTPFGNDLAETGAISGATEMVLGRIVEPPDNMGDKGPASDLATFTRQDIDFALSTALYGLLPSKEVAR